MKIVFLEPLGIPNETLKQMAVEVVGDRAEIVCYDNRVEDGTVQLPVSPQRDGALPEPENGLCGVYRCGSCRFGVLPGKRHYGV